ncbi:hypothetical protein [Klebsiella pneumoniae IS46]|nr:hypothetical protein UKKV901664_55320 [Klebsiella pneumoniae subsp. pneumoniae UKKV901664]CDL18479.1 hypothetical protein [Klebsiella pneumoniae IS46]CDL45449.1 hypothetical protein [Klebsiella pneumoniae ISC21]SXY43354.1 Uncharacterised protein [Klebsiella pneumoniae]VGE66293.1 Uncharacterised protein [Klebsiella pneumoniae]
MDAHFGQILLDRLSDTRLRIGIHHVQFGSKTVGETRFAEQLLRFCRVVAETLICLVITGHGGWQWLVGRRRASINDAHDAIFVDRHVHRLADFEIIERRQRGFHRHVAGLQLVAGDHQALIGRVVFKRQKLCGRYAVAGNIHFAFFQPQQSDRGILSHFELYVIQPRHAGFKVVRVFAEDQLLAQLPLLELKRAAADRMLAEVGTPFLHLLTGNHRGKVQRQHMQEGGVGLFQSDFYRMIVDDLDTAQGRAFTAGLLVIARDGTEEPGARTLGFRVDCAFQRIFHVRRRDLAAVVEFHPFA